MDKGSARLAIQVFNKELFTLKRAEKFPGVALSREKSDGLPRYPDKSGRGGATLRVILHATLHATLSCARHARHFGVHSFSKFPLFSNNRPIVLFWSICPVQDHNN